MVAGWMLYTVLVSALLLGAGLLLEEAGKRLHLPQRGVWGAMMSGSVLLPLLASQRTPELAAGEPTNGGMAGSFLLDPLRLTVPTSPMGDSLTMLLIAAWAMASFCLLGFGVVAAIRLYLAMGDWRLARAATPRLYMANDAGPAVIGILPGAIVLPAWSTIRHRRLMLTHEAEHLRAGDPVLLLAAHLLVALLPWNLPLWWHLRRLRLAVEVDCDARVLRRKPDLYSYATLLLHVGERRSALQPIRVAFAEPTSFLERRIRIMTSDRRRRGWAASLALASGAGTLLLAACSADVPTERQQQETGSATRAAATVEADQAGSEAPPPVPVVRAPAGEATSSDPLPSENPPPPPPQPSRSVQEATDEPDRIFEIGSLDRQPELRNLSEIMGEMERLYPPALQDAGVGGSVVLEFEIRADGSVDEGSVKVIDSTNAELDNVSVQTAQHFRFDPGIYDGRAVPVEVRMPITWQPAR